MERLEKILEELEDIRRDFAIKSLDKAIEDLKIAVKELYKIERKGLESLDHYDAKAKILEMIGGTHYLEAEHTKLSKIGYRPDAVVIKDREVVIVEVERDRRRLLNKVRKIKKLYNEILKNPILTGRKLRFVFGLVDIDLDSEIVKELKTLKDIEIYKIIKNKIKKIY